MSGEFVLNDDPERGIRVLGHFEPDGKMHVKVLQYIPDSFFDTLKAMRESFALRKKGTQSHWLPLPVLPTALADNLLRDGAGKPLRSEEHTSELQSLMRISYAVFCLKKKKQNKI